MIQQRNNMLWLRFNSLSRYIMINSLSGFLPLYIVNEFPKSGGTWVSQMLSCVLNVPFPKNRLPMLQASIMHGHYLFTLNSKNMVIVWRDGRDITTSLYFHSFYKNNVGNIVGVKRITNKINFKDINDVQNNLPEFIKYIFEDRNFPQFSWSAFVNKWYDRKDVVHIKYEDLRKNPVFNLSQIIEKLTGTRPNEHQIIETVDKYSFEKQAGRKPGEENRNSFLRKGIVNDWKNYFNEESRKLFNYYAGKQLIMLNYENDSSWVQNH